MSEKAANVQKTFKKLENYCSTPLQMIHGNLAAWEQSIKK